MSIPCSEDPISAREQSEASELDGVFYAVLLWMPFAICVLGKFPTTALVRKKYAERRPGQFALRVVLFFKFLLLRLSHINLFLSPWLLMRYN